MARIIARCAFLATIAVLAVAPLLASAAAECIHDHHDLMTEQMRMLEVGLTSQTYAQPHNTDPTKRIFNDSHAQTIRIVVDETSLTLGGYYCAAAGNTIPSYRAFNTTTVCGATNVVTSDKLNVWRTKILPPALERVQKMVTLERLTANLMVPASACGDVPIPTAHTTTGVANADLVVYVTGAPVPFPAVAFSGACRRDQTQRHVIGKLNFDPAHMVWSDTDFEANEEKVRVVVHELLHILGVSSIEMFRGNNKDLKTVRGRLASMSTRPTVLAFARNYTACSTLEGVEFENEGTNVTLTTSSHWEKRVWPEEAMTTTYGTQVSGLTLAFLHDINVGYSMDLSRAEGMVFAHQAGCGTVNSSCFSEAGGLGTLFCQYTNDTANHCTYDQRSIGYCAEQKYMDGCNMVTAYSNRRCWVQATSTEEELKYPYTFSSASRCFSGVGIRRHDFVPNFPNYPRCLEARCSNGAVQFKVPNNNTYATCGAMGSQVNVPGSEYVGQVVCPDAAKMCHSLANAVTVILTTTPPPTTSTATPPTTTAAPTTAAPTTTGAGGSTNAPVATTGAGGSTSAPTTTGAGGSTNAPAATTTGAGGSTNAVPMTTGAGGSTNAPATTTGAGGSTNAPATTTGAGGSTAVGVTTPPPTTTAPTPVPNPQFVVATIVIGGNMFAAMAANATLWVMLRDALRGDLAMLFTVAESRVVVVSMRVGSLVADYTVQVNGGAAEAASFTALANSFASSNPHLPRVSDLVRAMTPGAPPVSVTNSTGAVGTTTPSISGAAPVPLAAGVWGAAAVLALFASML